MLELLGTNPDEAAEAMNACSVAISSNQYVFSPVQYTVSARLIDAQVSSCRLLLVLVFTNSTLKKKNC
jgi:hypothetical protein